MAVYPMRDKTLKRMAPCAMVIGAVAALVCILYSLSVHGQDYSFEGDWKQFFSTPAGDAFYYDESDVKYLNNDLVVAVRIKGTSSKETQKTKEMVSSLEIDCRHETYRRVEGQLRFRDGSVSKDVGPSLWSDINYGSYLDALSKIVCKPKARRTLK